MPAETQRIDDRRIREFLDLQSAKYGRLLNHLVNWVEGFAEQAPCYGRIYRTYSRKDKQSGNMFKEVWKIREKTNLELARKPDFMIWDLGDVIGLTTVVIFPSDIEIVRGVVDQAIRSRNFISFDDEYDGPDLRCYGKEKKARGYYAHHYTLGVEQYKPLRCELQIKTVLHDAWGAKTHDLTYKPAGALEPRMREQIEVLGDALAAIDQQSELLKQLIQRRWLVDAKKAAAAKQQLVKRVQQPQNASRVAEFETAKKDILAQETLLPHQPITHDAVRAALSAAHGYVAEGQHDRDSCLLYCLIATLNDTRELADYAIDCINQWLIATETKAGRASALQTRGLAQFTFGNRVEAVQDAKEALETYQTHLRENPPKTTEPAHEAGIRFIQISSSLAYYFAELAGSDAGTKMDAEGQAIRYLALAQSEATNLCLSQSGAPEDLYAAAMLLDTSGAVKIAFAHDPAGVREGWDTCRSALTLMPIEHSEMARAIYALHELRAFQRILDLEQA